MTGISIIRGQIMRLVYYSAPLGPEKELTTASGLRRMLQRRDVTQLVNPFSDWLSWGVPLLSRPTLSFIPPFLWLRRLKPRINRDLRVQAALCLPPPRTRGPSRAPSAGAESGRGRRHHRVFFNECSCQRRPSSVLARPPQAGREWKSDEQRLLLTAARPARSPFSSSSSPSSRGC